MEALPMEIDDSLYSRQRYVLGDTAMHWLARSNILLHGLGGLGAEIAKNIVLAGVKSITIQDSHVASYVDLGTQFFLREDDVKATRNRAEASRERISELNSYVSVEVLKNELTLESNLDYLNKFQCIILTETSLPIQTKVNEYCRNQSPPIKFIVADVYGVFCWSFCDFGADFEVTDPDGEEPKEVFIGDISKANPGVVTSLEFTKHGFQSGDTVTFKELQSMQALNGVRCQIQVISPYKFSICDTTPECFTKYEGGGIVCQVKVPKIVQFESLQEQLNKPSLQTPDLSKFNAPGSIHVGMLSLHRFHATYGRLPAVWCSKDSQELVHIASTLNSEDKITDEESLDVTLIRHMAYTAQGCFAPLCAFLGGIVAQEALKSLTGKFSPLCQWLHLDAMEVLLDLEGQDSSSFQLHRTRYDALRMCIGNDLCDRLSDLNIFMVGCGAIGCELLKNFAMLGVGSSGKLTITDNDLIEKSNLNRQFLFRSHHIQKPKSTTAASSVTDINPDLNIVAHQYKVGSETEASVYTDQFFGTLDVAVNALDNLEARRYMDSRCVANQRPLLESGTMGTKGHVQTIVPFLTESYTSQSDPVEEGDIPYCTLRSFPSNMDHCIEWARDKFERLFSQKPSLYNKFWSQYKLQEAIEKLEAGNELEGAVSVSKLSATFPLTWRDCVELGRLKFEKFFNHKAKQLIHAFPLDTRTKEGGLFWQLPKRPPNPVDFDPNNPLHLGFVSSSAQLYADICHIPRSQQDQSPEAMAAILKTIQVPEFRPKNKRIETDETAKKPEQEDLCEDDLKLSASRLKQAIDRFNGQTLRLTNPAVFEKDDDSNGHINFIAATSNLRASMYGIETTDRLKIKRIAGRIVPAIATTTAAIAGLVTIELIKVARKMKLEQFKNTFINLAIPMFVLSEPGPVKKSTMSDGAIYTIWDKWEIRGDQKMTLAEFFTAVKTKYNKDVTFVVQGMKLIYSVDMLMMHKKRLQQPLASLIRAPQDKPYTDLVANFYDKEDVDGSRVDQSGPEIRFYFKDA